MHVGKRRNGSSGVVLLYHRLAEGGGDPLGLNVSPQRFGDQLRAVSERWRIAPLSELADRSGDSPDGFRVAITFDDGYRGVLEHAKPALERFDAQATAFVPSGFVDSGREFWWEELEGILLQDAPLPSSLELDLAGTVARWSAKHSRRRLRGPRVSARERLYYRLARMLARVDDEERIRVVDELSSWASVELPRRRDRMPMSASELRALAADARVEIGAHTVSHRVLAALDPAEQAQEVVTSKQALEQITAAPVTSFAYPYGGKDDYTRESVDAVRAAGFERACANTQGPVGPDADRFELPRFIVRDWEAAKLVRRLDELSSGRALRALRPLRSRAA